MDNIPWGLYVTAAGMGTVFGLLLVLMVVLLAIGRLDRRPSVPAESGPVAAPAAQAEPDQTDGLSPELVAAITVAVITHAQVRRRQAAPAMRRVAPGSQLFASRWVAIGRAYQNQPWR